MIIAVNSRFTKNGQGEGFENIMSATILRLAHKYPEHQFILIFDRPYPGDLHLPSNAQAVVSGPATDGTLRLQYWINYKLPVLLKKHKADVLVNLDGTCSVRTKIPQCLVVNDLGFINAPGKKGWLHGYYKKHMPAFLAKARTIVAASDPIRSILVEKYKVDGSKLDVVHPGIPNDFKPLDWEEKESIKEKYADGKAYFLFSGMINENSNLINLLKAFTFFKQRQKSNMLLIIAGKATESFKKEFRNYRLRNEVRLLEDLSMQELAAVTSAAYAMIYPVLYSDIAIPPLQAMQAGIPVVTSGTGSLPEVYDNAALYADPADHKDIAEQMMHVYKDEDRAKQLCNAGSQLVKQYQPDVAADRFMQSILKTFNG